MDSDRAAQKTRLPGASRTTGNGHNEVSMTTTVTNLQSTAGESTHAPPPTEQPPPLSQVGRSQPAVEDPRPTFSIREAADILGKSLRALERSLLGKWGNKLPDGWTARKIAGGAGMEWRIIPPPGFRVRPVASGDCANRPAPAGDSGEPELQLPGRPVWSLQDQVSDQPTIIIDRTDEIERLLRELVGVQKQLSEQRRMHLEDLRLLSQLQGSMRLLEIKASATETLKEELRSAQNEFRELRQQHLDILHMPWWKRLLFKAPGRKRN